MSVSSNHFTNHIPIATGFGRRAVVYFAGIVLLFVAPFTAIVWIAVGIPAARSLDARFLAQDGLQFDLPALEAALGSDFAERAPIAGCSDHVMLQRDGQTFRLMLLEPHTNAAAALDLYHSQMNDLKAADGIGASLQESVQLPGTAYALSRFRDGTSALTVRADRVVLQVLTPTLPELRPFFSDIGLLVITAELTPFQRWFSGLGMADFVLAAVANAALWLAWIFMGGAWVGRVPPQPGSHPIPFFEMRERLLRINQLDAPVRVIETAPGHLTVEWRLDEQWRAQLERQRIIFASAFEIRLHPGAVTVAEKPRRLVHENLRHAWRPRLFLFPRIPLKSYFPGHRSGLQFADGRFTVRDHAWRFTAQELRNPLIEAVCRSGWSWKPRLLAP